MSYSPVGPAGPALPVTLSASPVSPVYVSQIPSLPASPAGSPFAASLSPSPTTVTTTGTVTTGTFVTSPSSGINFEPVSFVIGIIIGIVIILIFVWIFYISRSFIFTYCAGNAPICTGNDFFNNPGNAIANGANIDDILFLNDKNEMFYKRVPATSTCVPSTGQTVEILYPQYCQFTVNGAPVEGKAQNFNNPVYDLPGGATVDTSMSGSCIPNQIIPPIATAGVPLLKWDSEPLPE